MILTFKLSNFSYIMEPFTSGTIIRFFGRKFEEELKNAYVMDVLLK